MSLIPVTHRIIVEPDDLLEEDEVYRSARRMGIEITNTKREQEAVDTGKVTAIGPTAFRDFGCECPLAIGDTVVFARYGGKKIKDGDKEFVALNDEDIVAIIKKD